MNYTVRLICISLLFSSCKKEPVLSFSSEIFTEETLEICQTESCSPVTIDYLKAAGDDIISDKINSEIKLHIIEALFLGEDSKPSAKDIPQAAEEFILAYRDHQPDIPTELDFGGYEAEITFNKTYQNEHLVSLEILKYIFTGGAHGYGGISFLNFDLETGETMKTSDLFIDFAEFESFAEIKFKEAHDIPMGDNINATGFWFDDDKFYIPKTVGFNKNKLVIIYNQYEISSYAEGPVLLEIPLEEATPFLDSNLL